MLLVGAGGGIGSILRYLCQKWIYQLYPSIFPWGTFLVNIAGCFLIGVFFAALEKTTVIAGDWRLFIMTGICGGYTTFSAFAFENMNLIRSGNIMYTLLYSIGSVVLGILAVFAGVGLMRSLL